MKYYEVYKDLFTIDKDKYVFGHCISKDCEMGLGIAVDFKKQFKGIKEYCLSMNPEIGDAILYECNRGKVFNLITKNRYSGKPTYETLRSSLISMKKQIEFEEYKYLAIPKIGCGLDKLQWGKVSQMIKEIFNDLDIEILVCRWK